MTTDIHPVIDTCWTVERPTLLNASEIAAVFGLHDFMTIAQLAAMKQKLEGLGPDPESALIRRGHALEPVAIDEIKKLHPQWIITRSIDHYVDHTHRLACTPDAFVIDPDRSGRGCLQIKVVSAPIFRRKWEDAPPISYLLQLSQEMMLTDSSWGAIGALVVGDFSFETYVFPVERNRSAELRLLNAAKDFWEAFDRGDMPSIDYERDGDLIRLMFPNEVAGKVVDLSTDNAIGELLERREILKSTLKDVEKRLESCESEIRNKVADAETAIVPGWRLSLKTQRRAGYEVGPTQFRVLRSSRQQEEKK